MKPNRSSKAKTLLLLLLGPLAQAQIRPDSTGIDSMQNRPYYVVRLWGDYQTLQSSFGLLNNVKYPFYRVTDSTVSVLRGRSLVPQVAVVTVPVRLIDELRIQKSTQRGGAGRGFLIGAAAGALISLSSGDSYFFFISG